MTGEGRFSTNASNYKLLMAIICWRRGSEPTSYTNGRQLTQKPRTDGAASHQVGPLKFPLFTQPIVQSVRGFRRGGGVGAFETFGRVPPTSAVRLASLANVANRFDRKPSQEADGKKF